jgi:hypothetical protein
MRRRRGRSGRMRAALCLVLAAAQPPEAVLRKRVAAEYVYVYENGGGQRTNGPPDKWPGQCKAPWLMTEELAVCCAGRCAEFCHEPCTGIGGFHVSNPPSLFDGCCANQVVESGRVCGESEPPCYTTAPLTKEAKSSTIAHVAIAAGRTHALGLVAAARSVVDASAEPKNLRLYLATDLVEGSRARSVLEQSLKCALPNVRYELALVDASILAKHSDVVAKVLGHDRNGMSETSRRLRSSPVNYARFFLEELFPSLSGKKVAYLDPDVSVFGDVAHLIDEAFTGEAVLMEHDRKARKSEKRPPPALAATTKTKHNRILSALYQSRHNEERKIAEFNAGVAVYDLAEWKRQKLTREVEAWIRASFDGNSSLSDHPTQTPLTLAVASNYYPIDVSWNCPIHGGRSGTAMHADPVCLSRPKIRHFTGTRKPWYPLGRLRFLWLPHVRPLRSCLVDLANLTGGGAIL